MIENNKKIVILTTVHLWDDTRIYQKQIQSLAREFPVLYYAPAPFERRIEGNVEIRGLHEWDRGRKSDRLRNIPALMGILIRHRHDIIHFHDPEIMPFALLGKWLFGTTIIMDIHENNEDDIRDKDWLPRPVGQAFAWVYRKIFHIAARFFDHLIIAVDHFIEAVPEKYRSKVISIHNYPRLELFEGVENASQRVLGDLIRLGYVGVIREERGLSLMCRLVEALDAEGRSVELDLVGNIPPGEPEEVIGEVQGRLSGRSSIRYHGLMPYREAMAVMQGIDIGLVIYMPEYNNINSNPNKLFEFMVLKKPVLASHFPIWRGILERSGGGRTVDPEDLKSVKAGVLGMMEDRGTLLEMGEKAYIAATTEFNWDSEDKKLTALYRKYLN